MNKNVFVILFVLMGGTVVSNVLQAAQWTGGGATRSWDEGANWADGTPPPAGEFTLVRHSETGDVPIEIGASVAALGGTTIFGNEFTPTAALGTVTVNVSGGGSLTTGDLNIGRNAGPATLNLSGATSLVNVTGSVIIGNDDTNGDATGTVNQTGGTFSVAALFVMNAASLGGASGDSIYNLHGGLLQVKSSNILLGPGMLMDITSGTMTVVGDRTATIDTAILDGKITSFGGTGVLFRSFDVANNLTTVWASQVPEPASLILVGLSGAMLGACRSRRRRVVI